VFCENCGVSVPPAAAFCTGCGSAVNSPPATTQLAAQAPPGALPSYGYRLDENPDQTTITVFERRPPARSTPGCIAAIFAMCVASLTAMVCLVLSKGALDIFVCSFLMVWIVVWVATIVIADRIRPKDPTYAQATVGIRRDSVLVNGTSFLMPHVRSWTIRWTEPGSVVAVGSYGYVAGRMIRAEDEQRAATQSYRITFDYGEQQITAVGGMTESTAERVMEAIQGALAKHP
jgi:hypothetical protein